jgi:uncharacterized zinc-type alcohol dehydrogenase-like protein
VAQSFYVLKGNFNMGTIRTKGYGAKGSVFSSLSLIDFERQAAGDDQLQIQILYCGVCHSDLHQVKNDWDNTIYPCVPGHEIIGRVASAGPLVTRFKPGDIVGVGCMIDSCGECRSCREGDEQYCEGPHSWTATYNGPMIPDGTNTYGGYSEMIIVKEGFVLKIPDTLDIASAAPILCAGVTTYSPLKHWNIKAGDKVGVIGLGGLGHMAVKIASAMGAEVSVITSHEEKRADAINMGASNVIISENEEDMKRAELSLNFILNTIPDPYDINQYISMLKRDGTIVAVGVLAPFKKATNNMEVAFHRRNVSGSLIGSIAETQEVLDFCAKHNIAPDVEMISIQDINKAFKKMEKEEVRYRFVIDMESIKKEE